MTARLSRALDRFWLTRERNRLLGNRKYSLQEQMMVEKANSIYNFSVGLNHHMRNALTVVQSFFDMIPVQLNQEIDGPPKDQFLLE